MSEWQLILDSTSTHDPLYNGWTYNNQGGDTLQTLSENEYGTDLIIKIELIQDVTNLSHVYYYKGIDIAFCLDVNSPHPFESNIISHNRYCYAKRDNQTEWTEIDLTGEHFDKNDTYWSWTVLTQPNSTSFNWDNGRINTNNFGFQSDPGPGTANGQNNGHGSGRWRIRAKGGWINGWSDSVSPNTFTYKLSVNTLYRYTPGSTPGADVYIGPESPEPLVALDLSNSSTWIQLVGDISSGSHDNEIVLTYYTSNNIPNYIRLNETVVGYTKDDPVIEHYSGMIDLYTYANIVKLESNSNYLKGIGGYKNNTTITEIDISNCYNFHTLGYQSFMNCTSLQSVKIQNCSNFIVIRGHTFKDCTSLSHFKVANCRILGREPDGIKPRFCEGCTNLNLLEFTDCPALSLRGFKQNFEGYTQFQSSNITNLYLYNTGFTEVINDPDIINVFFNGNNTNSANIYFTSPSNYESTNNFILPPSIREYHSRSEFNYPLSFNDIHMHINNSSDVSGTQCSLNDINFRKLANIYDSSSISLFNFFGKSLINICLDRETIINIIGSKYVFNNSSSYSANIVYGLNTGTYIFKNISSSHPMALLNKDISNLITYTGDNTKKSSKQVTNTTANGNYDFYWGDITVNVVGNFGTLSVYCFNHGYMGGENLLAYSDSCTLPSYYGVLGNWSLLGQEMNGQSTTDQFGVSIGINNSGNRVVIGAPDNDTPYSNAGECKVYEYNGTSWQQLGQDINGYNGNDVFGRSVTINSDGSRIGIGGEGYDSPAQLSGLCKIYEYNGSSWQQLGQDIRGLMRWDFLGSSISLNSAGNRIAIGGKVGGWPSGGSVANDGVCRIYEYNGSQWVQLGGDIDGGAGDRLGSSVSINNLGSRVVVGAPYNVQGYGKVLEYNGSSWVQLGGDINDEADDDSFGTSVAINGEGNRIVIGGPENDGNGVGSGHCRIYEYNASSWVQMGQDLDGKNAGDKFGTSVSINDSGDIIAIGSINNSDSGSNYGNVTVYELTGTTGSYNWQQLGSYINGVSTDGYFGASVSLNNIGDYLAIGANGSNKGFVYKSDIASG